MDAKYLVMIVGIVCIACMQMYMASRGYNGTVFGTAVGIIGTIVGYVVHKKRGEKNEK